MKKQKSWLFFFIFLILIFIILFSFSGLFSFCQKIVIQATVPVSQQFYSLKNTINQIGGFFSSEEQWLEENRFLRIERDRLLLENARLKIAEKENIILREQLNFLEDKQYQYIIANVIGRIGDNISIGELLILDKGEKDGIKLGYPVVLAQNNQDNAFLVGKIVAVKKNISHLLLITDRRNSVAAMVLNQEEISQGVVKGIHDLAMEIEYIPVNRKIDQGDLVVTSGLEEFTSKGLILGEIEQIIIRPGDVFQKLIIKPLISYQDFQVLTILKSKNENF